MKSKFYRKKFILILSALLSIVGCRNNNVRADDWEVIDSTEETKKSNLIGDDWESIDSTDDLESKEDTLINKILEILNNSGDIKYTFQKHGGAIVSIPVKDNVFSKCKTEIDILKKCQKNFKDMCNIKKLKNIIIYSNHGEESSINLERKIITNQQSNEETVFELLDNNKLKIQIKDIRYGFTEEYIITKLTKENLMNKILEILNNYNDEYIVKGDKNTKNISFYKNKLIEILNSCKKNLNGIENVQTFDDTVIYDEFDKQTGLFNTAELDLKEKKITSEKNKETAIFQLLNYNTLKIDLNIDNNSNIGYVIIKGK